MKTEFGGIVNASRSLICAYKSDLWKEKYKEEDFKQATRAEAIRMRDEINSNLKRISQYEYFQHIREENPYYNK